MKSLDKLLEIYDLDRELIEKIREITLPLVSLGINIDIDIQRTRLETEEEALTIYIAEAKHNPGKGEVYLWIFILHKNFVEEVSTLEELAEKIAQCCSPTKKVIEKASTLKELTERVTEYHSSAIEEELQTLNEVVPALRKIWSILFPRFAPKVCFSRISWWVILASKITDEYYLCMETEW